LCNNQSAQTKTASKAVLILLKLFLGFSWENMNELPEMKLAIEPANFLGCELHNTCGNGIERIIRANTDIFARVPFGTPLPDNNVTNFSDLAAEELYAKALGLRVAA
jgi:hypothetical protein